MSTGIIPIDVAYTIANLARDNPEQVYKQLKEAEDWVKEIKDIARKSIIKRMAGQQKLTIDTTNAQIQATAAKPKIKMEETRAMMALKGIDKALVMYPKPTEYQPLPNAHETLRKMFEAKLLSEDEYNGLFEEPIITVKVKNTTNTVDAE